MKSWEEIKHKATPEQLAQARRELNAVLLPAENAATVREAKERPANVFGFVTLTVAERDALVAQAETAEEKWVAARLMGDKWMERAEASEARLAQAQDALRQGTKIAAQYLDTGRGDLDGWIESARAALVAQAEAAAQRQHQCQFPSCVDGEKPPLCGHCGDAERAEAAEARLAQTQDALRLACADLQDLHAKFLDNRRADYEPPDDGDVTRLMGEMIARAALTGEGTE